jgi:phosphoserine phosphatase
MDMDSTLINEEGIDILAEVAGVGAVVRDLTDQAMAGQMDFYSSLRARVKLLSQQPERTLDIVRSSLTLTEGATNLIDTLKSRDWRIGVVSGGFHDIIDAFLEPLELDFVRANRFEIRDGSLTGEVVDPIIGPREKADALRDFANAFNIPLESTVAIGDGANDAEMIRLAGLGVAFCAKPALREISDLQLDDRNLVHLLDHI